MDETFKQLINLKIEARENGKFDISGNKNFSEIFPSLRSMRFKLENHPECIVHHFPHLKQVKLQKIGGNELRFFELNPQIRNIEIDYYVDKVETLRHTSKILPHLEFIKLGIGLPVVSDENNDLVHFKNVKTCVFHTDSEELLPKSPIAIPIIFDQLEEIDINQWVDHYTFEDFLSRQKTLKSFKVYHIPKNEYFTRLLEIAEELPNLVELDIQGSIQMEDEAMTILLTGKTNLKKIDIQTSENIRKMRTLLGSVWQIEYHDYNRLKFTRK